MTHTKSSLTTYSGQGIRYLSTPISYKSPIENQEIFS